MEMHSDAFRCICNGLARNLMPGILALAITGAAKTDIYNAVDSKYRQNWYPVHSLLLQTLANGCNAFVKARFVAIHMAWVFKYIHPEISLYSATYIAKRFRGSITSPYMSNICHLSSSPDTKRDSLLIFESTPFTEKVLWNCESNWWINR